MAARLLERPIAKVVALALLLAAVSAAAPLAASRVNTSINGFVSAVGELGFHALPSSTRPIRWRTRPVRATCWSRVAP